VIEPTSRSLVMRAGGTAKFADTSTLADDWRGETQVRRKSFEQASTALIDNFARELKGFEERVRSGTATVTVARRNGGAGALDATCVLLLIACLAATRLRRFRTGVVRGPPPLTGPRARSRSRPLASWPGTSRRSCRPYRCSAPIAPREAVGATGIRASRGTRSLASVRS